LHFVPGHFSQRLRWIAPVSPTGYVDFVNDSKSMLWNGSAATADILHGRGLDLQRAEAVLGPALHGFVTRKVEIAGIARSLNGLLDGPD
jgi:hypothetical protein